MYYYETHNINYRGSLNTPVNTLLSDDVGPAPSAVIRLRRLTQGSEHVFGDNSVSHYKMDVQPKQDIETTIPRLLLSLSDTLEERAQANGHWYTNQYYRNYTSGVNTWYLTSINRRIYDVHSTSGIYLDYSYVTITEWKAEPYPRSGAGAFLCYQRTATARNQKEAVDIFPTLPDTWSRANPASINVRKQVVEEVVWNTASPPYYWCDHMNQLFAEEVNQPSDAGALSECIRNTIQEYTTYDTNGYQNMLSFLDAIKSAKELAVGDLLKNSQNIWRELLEATGHSIVDDPVEAKRIARKALRSRGKEAAASAWLQYRYVYNTTKADYEQFVRAKVGEYLGALHQTRVLRGSIQIGGGVLRVKMRLEDNSRINFDKFLISANQYGLFPGLYNLWDMIPYSFIADWFSGLGDELQDIDQSIFFRYYEVKELLVSRSRSYHKDQYWGATDYKIYDRQLLSSMPQWEIYEDPKDSSGRTIFKRCLDGVSIVSGFI